MAPRILRGAVLVLLAALSYGICSDAVREIRPGATGHDLRARFEIWRDLRDDYTVLYLGSSILYRGIRPNIIDAALSTPDHPVRSFNLAAPGMFSLETDAVLERVLDVGSARLELIVLEVPSWRVPALFLGTAWSERAIAWHTPAQMRIVAEDLLTRRNLNPIERLEGAWLHLGHFARRQSNLGAGRRGVESAMRTRTEQQTLDVLQDAGWRPLERAPLPETIERRERFLESAEKYRAIMDERLGAGPRVAPQSELEGYNFRALRAQIERIERSGHRAVYVVPPQPEDSARARRLAADGWLPDLIDLNRPDLHPELFAVRNRFDASHLNARGAARFSALLAEELRDRLKASTGPARTTPR
jgi:hypothetical protein